MEFQPFGKVIIIVGIFLVVLGLLIVLSPKIPFPGRLPGDIYIKRENFSFYFPVITSILVSLVITIILNLFFGRR
ncbi:MAG: DUF2905 domain-containing protein [Thermodesulfobacteriota bacterium]